MADKKKSNGASDDDVAVVKKYANRRLYNTASSSYVTLDDLSKMVRDGENFVVFDAKSGEDLTRSILTQIILEEDGKGRNLLPVNFLRQLIRYYDDNVRAFLPSYLDMSMENFADNQDQIRQYFEGAFGNFFPMNQFEDMTKRNIALFQQAATMFNPGGSEDDGAATEAKGKKSTDGVPADDQTIDAQIGALKKELDRLTALKKQKTR
ncbi:MAG: polyhydroxyalkanoate synthesis repressor PhaR [Geminicoccales bacterium]